MRRAWTLTELLVVLAVAGLLAGLALPAAAKVREAANRARCLSHLKQIGLAAHAYADCRGHLPPSRLDCLAGTWHNELLPWLEQENVVGNGYVPGQPYHLQPAVVRLGIVHVFNCPSRACRGPSKAGDDRPPIPHRPGSTGDYAFCIGDGQPRRLDHSPPHAASLNYLPGNGPGVHAYGGPCPGRAWVGFADLTRGASLTLLVGEKAVDPRRPGEYPDNCIYNADGWETVGRFAGPRHPLGTSFGGPHPGVCLFALADGSARPLAATTDPRALAALSTRD
jgi:prepilin-type N-terminal cleavage/methylation domain-containing protein